MPYYLLALPTILRLGPYRLYFYSHEPNEPPHVHVDRDDKTAKLWIDPLVACAHNYGFSPSELTPIVENIKKNQKFLLEKWYEYFGT